MKIGVLVEKWRFQGVYGRKSGFFWKNGGFNGGIVENGGFSGKMGVLMGV